MVDIDYIFAVENGAEVAIFDYLWLLRVKGVDGRCCCRLCCADEGFEGVD